MSSLVRKHLEQRSFLEGTKETMWIFGWEGILRGRIAFFMRVLRRPLQFPRLKGIQVSVYIAVCVLLFGEDFVTIRPRHMSVSLRVIRIERNLE